MSVHFKPKRQHGRREKFAPKGQLVAYFDQLYELGCIQAGSDMETLDEAQQKLMVMYNGLYMATGGNPCDGCAKLWNTSSIHEAMQECKAFAQKHTMAREHRVGRENNQKSATRPEGTDQYPGMSVAEIAQKLGISKSEVRRRKQAGVI